MTVNNFKIDFKKISNEDHISEISLYINGENICLFKHKDESNFKTTRGNLDELVVYLRSLTNTLIDDSPFPFDVDGECAAELDNNARDFDTDNEEEFDNYYERLNSWGYDHSWHHASSGAILADIFFRKLDHNIEISWWSDEDGIIFKHIYGSILIPFDDFVSEINRCVISYNDMWL